MDLPAKGGRPSRTRGDDRDRRVEVGARITPGGAMAQFESVVEVLLLAAMLAGALALDAARWRANRSRRPEVGPPRRRAPLHPLR